MSELFSVGVNKYDTRWNFAVVQASSIVYPKSNSVMFITKERIERASVFANVDECLIFWPEDEQIPEYILERHAVVSVINPHTSFCQFFYDNCIVNTPKPYAYQIVGGAFIESGATVGDRCVIYPGAYIGKDVCIGHDCFIGSGVKLMGDVCIGNNVIIRENTVIGADGLTTDRDANGRALTMPQFGGVEIQDDVQIGANSVIARGAIDNTIIGRGVKIDNCTFVSHNVILGEDTFIVGESILFGSASTGKRVLISGNSLISNYVHIGDDTIIGQSSTVIKSVPEGKVAYGSPAKVVRDR